MGRFAIVILLSTGTVAGGSSDVLSIRRQDLPQRQSRPTATSRRLSYLRDGPPSEINCTASTPNGDYEYYIERCHDESTQLWINGHCKNGIKEEVSEVHRCSKSDGTRKYCHDCVVNDELTIGTFGLTGEKVGVITKHVCGADSPDYDEVCGIASTSSAHDCGEHRLKAYSHQCAHPENDDSTPSIDSWYLREKFYCSEQKVSRTGPNHFTCGKEWYYPFEEDEHESGEEHPFSNHENRYCLDCGMAIQVCASSAGDTCESLGLPQKVESANEIVSSASAYSSPSAHRDAWVAHGVLGALAFGLLVPAAIVSSDVLRSTYWIHHVHVGINILTFTMTFFAVCLAVTTMNGLVEEGGDEHLSEVHHLVGLLLLLFVSARLAIGFTNPEFLVDTVGVVFIFALGAYQVQSGLGLFARRYGTTDWGQVYLYGYVAVLAAAMLIAKCWVRRREQREMKRVLGENVGIQLPGGAKCESDETVGLT